MSTSGILSSSFLQNQLSSVNSPSQREMQKLSQDLQSGNLSAAQSDFAILQQAYSQSATTSPSSTSKPSAQGFNQFGTDLQSGNFSAAQKDFSTAQRISRISTSFRSTTSIISTISAVAAEPRSRASRILCSRISARWVRTSRPAMLSALGRLTPACSRSYNSSPSAAVPSRIWTRNRSLTRFLRDRKTATSRQ